MTLVEKLSGLMGVSRVVEAPKRELWRGGEQSTDKPRVLRRLWAMGLDYPWRFGMAVVAAAVAAFFQLKIPQLVGQAVDAAVGLLAAGGSHEAAQAALLTAGGLVLMAGIREENELADIPEALKGAAMSFLIAGILSMAFMGFAGLFSAAA